MDEQQKTKTSWLNRLACLIGWHEPGGVMEGVIFQSPSGEWRDMVKCANCGKAMKWRDKGGWDVGP